MLEEKRLIYHKEYQKESMIGILFIISGIFLFIFGGASNQIPMIIVGFILFLSSAYFFAQAQKHLKAFRALFKNELIHQLFGEKFEDTTYQHLGSIPIERINETKMIRKPDRFTGEDYLKGSYGQITFEVSDVDLEERVTRSNGKTTTTSYETYFKGRWYIFHLQKKFNEELKISEGSSYQVYKKDLVKVETESMEFNKKFNVYATTQAFAFYIITPTMIERFLNVEKKHKGSILFYLKDNELHVGINDRKDYLELSIKKEVTDDQIKHIIEDIDLIKVLIHELKLDTDKFILHDDKGEKA
jgi:hypothetical protein